MEGKHKESRSAAAWVCGILGLLFLGLTLVAFFKSDPFKSPLCFSLGVSSLGLCIVPLAHGRAGGGARVLGMVGLVGWVLLAFYFIFCFILIHGLVWYG